jgi:hypothetical protein
MLTLLKLKIWITQAPQPTADHKISPIRSAGGMGSMMALGLWPLQAQQARNEDTVNLRAILALIGLWGPERATDPQATLVLP